MQKNAKMQAHEKPPMCNNATAKRGSHMVVGFNSLVCFGWTSWLLLTHVHTTGARCTTQTGNGQGQKNFRHKRLPLKDFRRSPELDTDQSAHTIEKHFLGWRSRKNQGPRHEKTRAGSGSMSITMFDVCQTHTHRHTHTQICDISWLLSKIISRSVILSISFNLHAKNGDLNFPAWCNKKICSGMF